MSVSNFPAIHPVVVKTQNHKCEPAAYRKERGLPELENWRMHPLGTDSVRTKYHLSNVADGCLLVSHSFQGHSAFACVCWRVGCSQLTCLNQMNLYYTGEMNAANMQQKQKN